MTELFFSRNAANSFKYSRTIPLNLNTSDHLLSNTEFTDNEILVIELNLDLGPLVTIKEQNIKSWEYPRKGYASKKELEYIWNSSIEAITTLKGKKPHETVRIWWSDISSEVCGFYCSISLLYKSKCNIISMKMPFLNKFIENDSVYNWGTQIIEGEEWHTLISNERIINQEERKEIAFYWESLEKSDYTVRVQLNGNLLGVSDSFYDSFIYDCFNKYGSTTIEEIISKLSHMGIGLPDWWIINRLNQLETLGRLSSQSDNQYSITFNN